MYIKSAHIQKLEKQIKELERKLKELETALKMITEEYELGARKIRLIAEKALKGEE